MIDTTLSSNNALDFKKKKRTFKEPFNKEWSFRENMKTTMTVNDKMKDEKMEYDIEKRNCTNICIIR